MEKIKKFLNEYWVIITFFVFNLLFFYLPLPYVVSGTGGLIPIKDRFSIDGEHIDNYYMAYVSSYKGTPATVLYGLLKKGFDVDKMSLDEQELDDLSSQALLSSSSNNSVIYAYLKAGKEVSFTNTYFEVLSFDENSSTDLKVGDKIYGADMVEFSSTDNIMEEFKNIIDSKEVGDRITLLIERDGKRINGYADVYLIDDEKKTGIFGFASSDIKMDPEIKFSFDEKESGPSGGFMLSLAIYDLLTEENVSHGLKISGTGTIDTLGNVGVIGGVSYKIMGAKKEDIDVFFVPDDNYLEASEVCADYGCDFDLVKISTFDDALEYLKNYD